MKGAVLIADNVLIDNGSETDFTAATNDVSGIHWPFVKIASGTLGSTEKIGGDAANGLDVDVTRLPALPAGTNNIGDVDVLTLPALPAGTNNIGDVDCLTEPALDVSTDQAGAAHMTNVIMNDRTELTPKYKSLTVAASQTDSSVVAAVTSKKLRVLSLSHQCGSSSTTATYESDGGSDTRLHKVPAGANGGQILPFNPVGWFETLSGEALIVTTGAGADTEITLTYVEV